MSLHVHERTLPVLGQLPVWHPFAPSMNHEEVTVPTNDRQLHALRSRRLDLLSEVVSAARESRKGSLLEGDDDYAHVVALLNPRHRVILSKQGAQWVLQRRDVAVGTVSRTAWRKLALCDTRDDLIAAIEAMGIVVDPSTMDTLNDLPERAALCPSPMGLRFDTDMPTPQATGMSSLAELMDRRRASIRAPAGAVHGSTRESDDHYRKGVCRLNDGWRVILDNLPDRAANVLVRS